MFGLSELLFQYQPFFSLDWKYHERWKKKKKTTTKHVNNCASASVMRCERDITGVPKGTSSLDKKIFFAYNLDVMVRFCFRVSDEKISSLTVKGVEGGVDCYLIIIDAEAAVTSSSWISWTPSVLCIKYYKGLFVYIAGQASRNHALIISTVFVYNSGNGWTTTTREVKDNIFNLFLFAELFYFSRVFFSHKHRNRNGENKNKTENIPTLFKGGTIKETQSEIIGCTDTNRLSDYILQIVLQNKPAESRKKSSTQIVNGVESSCGQGKKKERR